MTANADQEREAFGQYLHLLTVQSQRGASFDASASEVREASRSQANEAALVERQAKDAALSVKQRLDALTPRIGRLTARAELGDLTADGLSPDLRSIGDCVRAVAALEADLKSAESSWQWIERNNTPRPSTAASPPEAASPPLPTTSTERAKSQGGRNPAVLALVAVLAVVVVLAVLIVVIL